MSALFKAAPMRVSQRLFIPQLDGLRFFAFLAVFIHHSPEMRDIWVWEVIRSYGWIGVELFFSISAFLFFHLLSAEDDQEGSISVSNFYKRRALRIFPLLWVFIFVIFLFFSDQSISSAVRASGAAFGLDNVIIWISGYNKSLPYSGHLWTLSFEAQVYLLIPLSFLAYKNVGPDRFRKFMIFIWVFCFFARALVALSGAVHPVVWVSPFLRPEAVLLGIALAIKPPSWRPAFSLLGALVSLVAVTVVPPLDTLYGSIFVYLFTGVAVTLIVDAAIRAVFLGKVLAWRPIRFVGKISFGMYVFHVLTLSWTKSFFIWLGFSLPNAADVFSSALWVSASLAFCFALSVLSYYLLEQPFLRIKSRRYSAVEGRA